jgi:hypothetical protein
VRRLFARLDAQGCYEDIDSSWRYAIDSGDFAALRRLLESRRDCEYEGWDFEEVNDPCTP